MEGAELRLVDQLAASKSALGMMVEASRAGTISKWGALLAVMIDRELKAVAKEGAKLEWMEWAMAGAGGATVKMKVSRTVTGRELAAALEDEVMAGVKAAAAMVAAAMGVVVAVLAAAVREMVVWVAAAMEVEAVKMAVVTVVTVGVMKVRGAAVDGAEGEVVKMAVATTVMVGVIKVRGAAEVVAPEMAAAPMAILDEGWAILLGQMAMGRGG